MNKQEILAWCFPGASLSSYSAGDTGVASLVINDYTKMNFSCVPKLGQWAAWKGCHKCMHNFTEPKVSGTHLPCCVLCLTKEWTLFKLSKYHHSSINGLCPPLPGDDRSLFPKPQCTASVSHLASSWLWMNSRPSVCAHTDFLSSWGSHSLLFLWNGPVMGKGVEAGTVWEVISAQLSGY